MSFCHRIFERDRVKPGFLEWEECRKNYYLYEVFKCGMSVTYRNVLRSRCRSTSESTIWNYSRNICSTFREKMWLRIAHAVWLCKCVQKSSAQAEHLLKGCLDFTQLSAVQSGGQGGKVPCWSHTQAP